MSKLTHEGKILVLALLTGLPGTLAVFVLLWHGNYSARLQWTVAIFLVVFWLGCAMALRRRVVFPLQTLANILEALREGDFSLRARGARRGDTLGEVLLEANILGETLWEQRLGAVEATALLQKVIAEIDLAVFAFDEQQRLQLVNRAGENLLAQPAGRLLGRRAAELGLGECLDGEPARTLQKAFPGGAGRWGMRRSSFRAQGVPHQMLMLADLSQALREEEQRAWRRLIRVLGHELNNSLAPIKSLAGSLESLLQRDPRPADWEEDMRRGLHVIAGRSESLSHFMEAYARLARLPQPRIQPLDVGAWVRRVAGLETRLEVALVAGPEITIQADGDQLDQLLINLVRNAVDAALETQGQVKVGWSKNASHLDVWVEDEGPGIGNTTNLFVPFFTTKPGGSGIGLVLSRQIAEAHGGHLTLKNRTPKAGCLASVRLPL
ncbi:MAG: ATP-binding protein [Acidobacteriota bacterium]